MEKLPDKIHFIGIGGAGMAPIAGILHELGITVSGSDLSCNSLTRQLTAAGVQIKAGHSPDNLPNKADAVVYSSAVKPENPELIKAKQLCIPLIRRGDMLGRLAAKYQRPVAISGSHGKTTVTAMLTHILLKNNIDCGYMIGGKTADSSPSSTAGNGDIFVTEVDESDGTHTCISPYLGLVPNVEDDHSWSVGGSNKLYQNFSTFGRQSRHLITIDGGTTRELFKNHPNCTYVDYAKSIAKGNITGLAGKLYQEWGDYQLFNAALAVKAAEKLGLEAKAAGSALNSFPGVARRMTVHFSSDQVSLVEDYAHHPTEVRVAIAALRKRYPEHHLRIVFQPHRYARLEKYFDAFAEELAAVDSLYIAPVFAAWTEHAPRGSKELAAAIPGAACIGPPWKSGVAELLSPVDKPLLLAVFGAGDIDELIPEIKNRLTSDRK